MNFYERCIRCEMERVWESNFLYWEMEKLKAVSYLIKEMEWRNNDKIYNQTKDREEEKWKMRQAIKEFTITELATFNGKKGNPAYIAVNGVVYDVTYAGAWGGGTHFGIVAGSDASATFQSCHNKESILNKLSKVGVLKK